MEPTTLIISALVAGATAALQETASQAVKDAYAGLKALIQKRFAGQPEAEMALAQHEKKPEVWEAPLKDALAETGADKDKALLQAAERLLKLVQPQQVGTGKYSVQIGEAQGVVIGDQPQVEQHFGQKPKSE
jgi:hypothetical protein